MLYEYRVQIPLVYNRFAIHSNYPYSEIRYKLENKEARFNVTFSACDIPGYKKWIDFTNIVNVKLYNDGAPEDVTESEDVPRLFCDISGLLMENRTDAERFAEQIVNRICKELSLVFIKYNANRQFYQPRVDALWSQAKWTSSKFLPYVEAKHKTQVKDDHIHKKVVFEENIFLECNIHWAIVTVIPTAELEIEKWLLTTDETFDFLINEYYSALGTEKIKSKFFHLFSIIEFCEKEYQEYNGSQRLLTDDEVGNILLKLKSCMEMLPKGRVLSVLNNVLLKVDNIGRAKKLENILQWMGIKEYSYHDTNLLIDKKLLEVIIKVRNKSFHGTKESEEEVCKIYTDAVEKLLYIDEKILEFVRISSRRKDNKLLARFSNQKL